jgi:3',5'-cyclic AMP phosphodiesterase CpdA
MLTNLSRREFVTTAMGGAAVLPTACGSRTELLFGLIADLHHNFMPHAELRLQAFLEEASRRRPDFVIQLGDFFHGYSQQLTDQQKTYLEMWNSAPFTRHNVLGNHEMDSCPKQFAMGLLEMPKPYYSFDLKGFHFVILDCMHVLTDGRYVDYDSGNYHRFEEANKNWVDPDQLAWLKSDLKHTNLPTVVFTHPSLQPYWEKDSAITAGSVRNTLADANREAGRQKVVACLSGHEHIDFYALSRDINYVIVNSASYYSVGNNGELTKYRDPLFTFVTLDARSKTLRIEGRHSEFIPPTPAQLGQPNAKYLSADIAGRVLHFA